MTDSQFLLEVLSDGEPHSQADLLRRSFQERGHGCTIHSRVADLRKQGHLITCERVPGETRGRAWRYQLLSSSPQASPPSQSTPDLSPAQRLTAVLPPEGGRDGGEVPLFEMPARPAWG